MPNFDGGLFFLMLGLGLIFLISSIKFGPIFQLVGGIIFLVLGVIMFGQYDVAFYTTVTDGVNEINQTNYVIGDGVTKNSNATWLGWIFLLIGLLAIVVFFVGMLKEGGTS